MGKRWIFALTVAVALGLIGLLAYTSESVHRVTEPAPTITEVPRPRIAPAPAEAEARVLVYTIARCVAAGGALASDIGSSEYWGAYEAEE
jgi:hypothetical protein